MPRYGRILLKISGEVLAGDGSFGIDPERVKALAAEIAEVAQSGVQIGLVVGGGNFFRGVAAAAQTYFGVPVSKLTISQDAVIAGIIQQPSTFPLPKYRASLKARWQYVLGNMVRDGSITAAQKAAAKFPSLSPQTVGNGQSGATGYLMEMVYQELEATYGYTQQQIDTALRVAHDIITGAKTPEQTQASYVDTVKLTASGKSSPYTDGLMFSPDAEAKP